KPNSMIFISYPNPNWVPLLDILGELGFKLKGKDNRVYYNNLKSNLSDFFSFKFYEGHMLASKLPKILLSLLEYIECLIPQSLRRKICIMNIVVLTKK
ncbi:MAG: hypothetical protein PHG69_02160, partial [Candidatus Omnitrophica bacterium]|nr:hypothetical protein [Candidatus Omnitrophota bacterium]